jgi:hypothetical protein
MRPVVLTCWIPGAFGPGIVTHSCTRRRTNAASGVLRVGLSSTRPKPIVRIGRSDHARIRSARRRRVSTDKVPLGHPIAVRQRICHHGLNGGVPACLRAGEPLCPSSERCARRRRHGHELLLGTILAAFDSITLVLALDIRRLAAAVARSVSLWIQDHSRFQTAMQRGRQPKPQQQPSDNTTDETHATTERLSTKKVNPGAPPAPGPKPLVTYYVTNSPRPARDDPPPL